MTDKANRLFLIMLGAILLAGGGLTVCLGAGVFGSSREHRAVFDSTVVRWWNEGGWMSYAVVVAIAAVFTLVGVLILLAQLRRNDGQSRTPDFALPATDGPGETAVRAAALSHAVEHDLESFAEIDRALVALFGRYPDIEMRVFVEVTDDTNLDELTGHVDEALARLQTVAGLRPDPLRVTVRFNDGAQPRQLA